MRNSQPAEAISLTGDIIGPFESVSFEKLELSVARGDRFILFSDGLIERTGKKFVDRARGFEEVRALCDELRGLPLDAFIHAIPERLFATVHPQDDLMLLGVEV
jgi:sigma-B regulation protein RsbU (phosphoserine phosphatase)